MNYLYTDELSQTSQTSLFMHIYEMRTAQEVL